MVLFIFILVFYIFLLQKCEEKMNLSLGIVFLFLCSLLLLPACGTDENGVEFARIFDAFEVPAVLTKAPALVGNQHRTYLFDPAKQTVPETHIEALAAALLKRAQRDWCGSATRAPEVVEWWPRVLHKRRHELDWHVDVDEQAAFAQQLRVPSCGAALTLSAGGRQALELLDARLTVSSDEPLRVGQQRRALRVPAKRGRLTVFGQGVVHGVRQTLDSSALAKEERGDRGARITLLFSFWPRPGPSPPHCDVPPWSSVFAAVPKLGAEDALTAVAHFDAILVICLRLFTAIDFHIKSLLRGKQKSSI